MLCARLRMSRLHLGCLASGLSRQAVHLSHGETKSPEDKHSSVLALLVEMPRAPSSFLFLVVRPGAPSSFLLLVRMPLVAMPGAPSSFLFLVVRPGSP